jgi:two-component sensor histidine kinase
MEKINEAVRTRTPVRFEDRRGSRIIDNSIVPVIDEKGTVTRLAVFGRDITERKAADEALARSLEEKQSLLRELQHRIKNTFSMITSIVNIEAGSAENPIVGIALDNIRSRISSLSDLYSLLYASGEEQAVHLDAYIKSICDSVMTAYATEDLRVDLTCSAEEVLVDMKRATVIGLLTNEILTNAFKHAFQGRINGIVKTKLSKEGDDIVLEIADDGVGLPEGFDLNSLRSSGMRIAVMLTKQLNGTMDFERGAGTTFRIKLPAA